MPDGTAMLERASVLLALVLGLVGCGEVRYGPPRTYDRVLSARPQRVAGETIDAWASQLGTVIRIEATARCNLVEMQEIERTSVRQSDEDHTLEWVMLGISSVPLATGVLLLADSPNVYEEDRAARQYNPVGPTGAIAGGVALVAVGSLVAIASTAEIIRTSGDQEEEFIVHEPGRVLQQDVPCDGRSPAVDAPVVLRLPAAARTGSQTRVRLGSTDGRGRLEVDLAQALAHGAVAGPELPRAAELWVGPSRVGMVDLEPVRQAWPAGPLRIQAPDEAQQGSLQQAEPPDSPQRVEPASPTENEGAEPALGPKGDGAMTDRPTCERACRAGCRDEPGCVASCRKEACP